MLAGVPFGLGVQLIFNALLNYLTDAYRIYAASELAASTFSRSICAALLSVAVNRMYSTLGIAWATSLLGFVSVIMAVIPFLFIKYGSVIRGRSAMCLDLEHRRQEEQRRSHGIALTIQDA